MQIFMFVGFVVIEIRLFNRKKKKKMKKMATLRKLKLHVLQAILDFFSRYISLAFGYIISFQHVFHLGVGRSQIEWKLKVKTQISIFP